MSITSDIISPFDGVIHRVNFQTGDTVKEGDVLFSISVKGVDMDILSPLDGRLDKIEVSIQDPVITGMILATITE